MGIYCFMNSKKNNSKRSPQSGFVLIAVLILMVILVAILAGVIYSTTSERGNSASDQRKNFAFYAAEAGMEQMTANLGTLYTQFKSPTVAQLQTLGNCPPACADPNQPVI